MITDISRYVFVAAECFSIGGTRAMLSRLVEFDEDPSLSDIQNYILEEVSKSYPDNKWSSCVILNLQFMTRNAYYILSGTENPGR